MKAKKFWSIFTMLVLVLSTAFAFSSCKDDDEEDKAGYSIIGTWKYTFYGPNDYVLLTFNADGTGRSVEFDDGEIDGDKSFLYSYTENILTVYYEKGYKEVVMIKWQNKNKFITSWYDAVDTWIRQ